MATRNSRHARRFLVVLVLLVLVSAVLTGSVSARSGADGCTLTVVGETQYISCWNGKELESRQVPEYLVGAGAIVARRTGEVVWVPDAGEVTEVRQTDDDQLVVRVARPIRLLFFFNLRPSHEIRLDLDIEGNIVQ